MQAEGEIGRREDGERFDEDVGDGLVSREVGVKLIPTIRGRRGGRIDSLARRRANCGRGGGKYVTEEVEVGSQR